MTSITSNLAAKNDVKNLSLKMLVRHRILWKYSGFINQLNILN